MVSSRRGSPSRRATLVAAAASVGPTAVPSTKDIAHDRCPIQWATAATPGRRGHHQADGEQSDRARVAHERGGRRGGRRVEHQQRQQAQQHHLGLQRRVGDEGQEADDQPGHHQHRRRRHARPAQRRDRQQGDGGDGEDDDQVPGDHTPIVPGRREGGAGRSCPGRAPSAAPSRPRGPRPARTAGPDASSPTVTSSAPRLDCQHRHGGGAAQHHVDPRLRQHAGQRQRVGRDAQLPRHLAPAPGRRRAR